MRRIALLATALAVLFLAPAARAGTPAPGFTETPVATGLAAPTGIAFLPDGRMLIIQKAGALKLASGVGSVTTLMTVPVCTASEMGLLGVAVDPDFTTNGYVYLYRTKPDPVDGCVNAAGRFNQVVRVTMTGSTVDPASLTELLTGIRTDNGNHDGGTVRIGPDDKLWVTVGDTGLGDGGPPGSSTNPYSQDLGSLEGKILRLELTGAPAAGNPFIGTPGARPEVYAYGLRNPFRGNFDPQTGSFWVGDVGQSSFEELDIVSAGGNYSWPRCEGTQPPGCMTDPADVAPIFTYPLTGPGSLGRTIIGGHFAPAGFGAHAGDYFFGDTTANKIYRADVTAARDDIVEPVSEFVTGADGPVDVVFAPGALYYVSIAGQVRQVTQTSPYARPGGGDIVRTALAPAYAACTNPNAAHVPPLVGPSCAPPSAESQTLTTSTVGRGSGSVRLKVLVGDSATPADEADVEIHVSAFDVVCATSSTACPGGAGSDYAGSVAIQLPMRVTDKRSSVFEGVPATVADTTLALPAGCVATPASIAGGTCSLATTVDALVPGFAREGRRTIIQSAPISLTDPGPDGELGPSCPPTCSTGDERVYLNQALFLP